MTETRFGWFRLCVALIALHALFALPAKAEPKNPSAKALPDGAIARLGSLQFRHFGAVTDTRFLPDGKRVLSCGDDGAFRLWDAATGELLNVIEGLAERTTTFVILPDGKQILSGDTKGILVLWELETGNVIRKFAHQKEMVRQVLLLPDGERAIYAADDRNLHLFSIKDGNRVRIFEGHTDMATCVALHPDGKRVLSAGSDKVLRLWSLDTGKEIREFKGHDQVIWSVHVHPDGKLAVSSSEDWTARVWDLETGKEVDRLGDHRGAITGAWFVKNGSALLTSSLDRTAAIWSFPDLMRQNSYSGHTDGVWKARLSNDGKYLVTGSWDQSVRTWEVETGKPLVPFEGHRGWVIRVAPGPGSDEVVSGGDDGTVRLWNAETGEQTALLMQHQSQVRALASHPEEPVVWSGSLDNRAMELDAKGKNEARKLINQVTGISAIKYVAEENMLILIGSNGTTTARSRSTGETIWEYGLQGPVRDVDLHGDTLYLLGLDRLQVMDIRKQTATTASIKGARGIRRMSWVPGERLLLSDGQFLYRVDPGEERPTPEALPIEWKHAAMEVSPDRRRVALGGADGKLRILELETYRWVREFSSGHEGSIRDVAWLDNYRVVSGGADGILMSWDMRPRGVPKVEIAELEGDEILEALQDSDRCVAVQHALLQGGDEMIERIRPMLGAGSYSEEAFAVAFEDLAASGLEARERAMDAILGMGSDVIVHLEKRLGDVGLHPEKKWRAQALIDALRLGDADQDLDGRLRLLDVLEWMNSEVSRGLLNSIGAREPETVLTRVAGQCALRLEGLSNE